MVVGQFTQETKLAVIGGGAGGYAAALRASELDVPTILVDPLGVCPHLAWLASKTIADLARVSLAASNAAACGLEYGQPRLDLTRLRQWTDQVGEALTTRLERLCTDRGVEIIRGMAAFDGPRQLVVHNGANARVRFRKAIVATGADPLPPPGGWPDSVAFTRPAGVLERREMPKSLLVIGGEAAALEIAVACAGLGCRVSLAAPGDRLLTEADDDLVRLLERRLGRLLDEVSLSTTATVLGEGGDGVQVEVAGAGTSVFSHVVLAHGAAPRTSDLGLDKAQVETGDDGSIRVDGQLRTTNERILAVGDVTGGPMLANRAIHQGRAAAEIVAGHDATFEPRAVPSAVFTDPPIAWCGLTERQAVARGIPHEIRRADWSASARAVSLSQADGLTKLIIDAESGLLLGMGIIGAAAPEMIGHGAFAIEMGAVADDLAAIVHAHPSLSELIGDAARG